MSQFSRTESNLERSWLSMSALVNQSDLFFIKETDIDEEGEKCSDAVQVKREVGKGLFFVPL